MTVPNKTLAKSPVRLEIQSTDRTLAGGSITFPAGCAGLVGVRFLDRGSQFAPYGTGWITGNGEAVSIGARELEGSPYKIFVEAYNSDDTYTHNLLIRLDF